MKRLLKESNWATLKLKSNSNLSWIFDTSSSYSGKWELALYMKLAWCHLSALFQCHMLLYKQGVGVPAESICLSHGLLSASLCRTIHGNNVALCGFIAVALLIDLPPCPTCLPMSLLDYPRSSLGKKQTLGQALFEQFIRLTEKPL